MSLRTCIVFLVVVLCGVGGWFLLTSREAVPEYNIVLVTFDTTRADRIGCYGAKSARTPTLDAMARDGIRYSKCYATGPITQPSHTSLLTGLYPMRHGIRDNGDASLSPNAVTLAETLKDVGYQTGAVIGAFVLDSQFGLDQGFDFYDDDLSWEGKQKFGFAERQAGAVTDSALAWLNKVKESKYFLWAHYFDPHALYAPPGVDTSVLGKSLDGLKKLYDLEIAYTDSQLGRLLSQVHKIEQETGRPTLFVFTSDHGEALGAHGEPSHGMFVYNDTVHVPLIVLDSTKTERNVVVDTPVSICDVFPTILDRLKIDQPYQIDGVKLPVENTERPDRAIYFETFMPFNNYGWSPLDGVVMGDNKFISAPNPEYFNVKTDPSELNNLYKKAGDEVEDIEFALQDVKEAELEIPNLSVNETQLTSKEIRKLVSLGYLSTGSNESLDSTNDLADPKDKIDIHRRLLKVKSAISLGKIQRAYRDLSAIIQDDPNNKHVLDTLVLMASENISQIPAQEVIPLVRKWLDDRPNAQTAVALGMLYEKRGNYANALKAFDKAVELDDSNPAALNNTAYYLLKLNEDLERALKLGEKALAAVLADDALKGNPPEGHSRHTIACIQMKLGMTQEAVENLQLATKLVPDFASAFYQLAVARQKLGENEMAIRLFEHSVKISGQPEPEWLEDAKTRLAKLQE